jgi:hypothetical protein
MSNDATPAAPPQTGDVVLGEQFCHFKGGLYHTVAAGGADLVSRLLLRLLVVYRGRDGRVWVRTRYGWNQTVRRDGVAVPRIERVR